MFLLILVVGVHGTNNTHKDGGGESEVSEILPGPCQKMSSTKYLKGECQQCRGHIEFAPEAVGTTTECPHCGQTTELLLALPPTESLLPTKAIVYTIIAIVILVGGLIGTQIALKRAQRLIAQKSDASPMPPTKQPTAQVTADSVPKDGFRVSSVTLEKTPGSSLVYAVGTIRNITNRQRFGVTVELELLDDTDKKIGEAKDYQNVIEPNGEWQFRALVVHAKTASAKVSAIKEVQ